MDFIANTYGSKVGAIRFYMFGIAQLLGRFNAYRPKNLDWIERLIFICSGNICRSPLGHCVADSIGFQTDSYGLHCRGDDEAYAKTIKYGKKHDLPVQLHRSKNIRDYEPRDTDLLIVVEPSHLKELNEILPTSRKLMLGFLTKSKNVYIHDPYSCSEEFFESCMEDIELATKRLVKEINAAKA